MSLSELTAPASEPVSLSELKQQLRVTHGEEDDFITGIARAARIVTETVCRKAWVSRAFEWTFDQWPEELLAHGFGLPLGPVMAIDEVAIAGSDGSFAPLDSSSFALSVTRPRLTFTVTPPAPGLAAGGIRLRFTAGYGTSADVPAPVRQAISLLTAHYFERREPYENSRVTPVPETVAALLAPYREMSL